MKRLTEQDVEFEIICEPEEAEIRGNASAIDDETDAKVKSWIGHELDNGNQWAWCCVTVIARWEGLEGSDLLGCCSYGSEEDFKRASVYYKDMKTVALADLQVQVNRLSRAICGTDA